MAVPSTAGRAQITQNISAMTELKYRRIVDMNQKLRDDFDRPRCKTSDACAKYIYLPQNSICNSDSIVWFHIVKRPRIIGCHQYGDIWTRKMIRMHRLHAEGVVILFEWYLWYLDCVSLVKSCCILRQDDIYILFEDQSVSSTLSRTISLPF